MLPVGYRSEYQQCADNTYSGFMCHHFLKMLSWLTVGQIHKEFYFQHELLLFSHSFYPIIERLALWAGSKKIGFAVPECRGVMEYWSLGILDLVE
jgi:hypothetical protein